MLKKKNKLRAALIPVQMSDEWIKGFGLFRFGGIYVIACWMYSLFRGCWTCEVFERCWRTSSQNWWATFCRALKQLRNILFILQQSGICFFEWRTCVIQGVLQVFGLHRVFINQTDTGINRKSWLQNVGQDWEKPLVIPTQLLKISAMQELQEYKEASP